jgi:hypothetical protein
VLIGQLDCFASFWELPFLHVQVELSFVLFCLLPLLLEGPAVYFFGISPSNKAESPWSSVWICFF